MLVKPCTVLIVRARRSSHGVHHQTIRILARLRHRGAHLSHGPWQRLEAWGRTHFPQAGRVMGTWSGIEYRPADVLGLYGRDPIDASSPPIYIATGHGGSLEWTGVLA
jgi:hypothetical protein